MFFKTLIQFMKAPSSKKEILPPEVYSIKTLNKNPEEGNEQKCSMVYLNLNTKSVSFLFY